MSCIKLMNSHRPSLAVSVAAGRKVFYIQRLTPANHPRHLDCLNPMWNISHGYAEQLHLAPQVSLLSNYLTHFWDFLPVFINRHWCIWQIVVSDSHQHACNTGSVMLKQRTMCSSTGAKKKCPTLGVWTTGNSFSVPTRAWWKDRSDQFRPDIHQNILTTQTPIRHEMCWSDESSG